MAKTKRPPSRTMATKARAKSPSVLLADAEHLFGITVDLARDRHGRLTPRETQVAVLMAAGKQNRAIAEDLGISPKTLDIHRANLMHKLDAQTPAAVANVVNLVRMAELAEVFGG
jgi:FixJ family two-component response regulator